MTLEELEEDFIYWNEIWLRSYYDPKTEADLWEAEQGEVIYGEKESRPEE